MSRGKQRVHYQLDSGGITHLEFNEIKVILRAADELIATGGRTILSKLLKGSRDKKVLDHGLDQCPAYGFYLLIEKIEKSGNPDFIPLLRTWQSTEYKKVRIELQKAINNLILKDDSVKD